MRKPNFSIGIFAAAIVTCVAPVPAAPQGSAAPMYERVPCDFSPRARLRDLTRECGVLTVPEVRGKANGRTHRLAVVVYHPPEPDGSPPLLLLQGGPGGIGSTTFPWAAMTWPLARHRDVVTFDYRAVGRSEPKLCPDFNKQADPAFQRTAGKERQDVYNAAVRACLATLDTQKIDRNAFGGDVFAQDAIDLRRALGYPKWDVYGVSYGGVVVQELMRQDPQGTRAAVMVGTTKAGGDYAAFITLAFQQHLERVFAGCAEQTACRSAYPRPAEDFNALYREFSDKPVEVALADTSVGRSVLLNGETFLHLVRTRMGHALGISRLPMLLHELRRGNRADALRRLVENSRRSAWGPLGHLVWCNEYGTRYRGWVAQLKPKMSPPIQTIADDIREHCDLWLPDPKHELDQQPLRSDIPTLIIDGEWDNSRVAERAQREIAERLTHAYRYTLSHETHANEPEGCHGTLIQTFLVYPDRGPDATCIARMSPLRFNTRSFAPTLTIVIGNTSNTPAPLAGTWEATLPAPPRSDYTMQLEYNGSRLQGTVLENLLPLYDGRIEGTTVSFKTRVETRTITFTGKLQGDTLSFTREVDVGTSGAALGLFGSIALRTFTARRVQ